MPRHFATSLRRLDFKAILFVTLFFAAFFAPILFTGRYLVGGDSLVYSYPLRTVAWDMIRHGQLPLWTPLILSGYPLFSMAQLGIAYPGTWSYLFLPGYLAEEIYVLLPFLCSPLFAFAYLRAVGCSRMAALLGGLSFGYGGMMAGGLSHNGMFTNAVMWLPLFLLAIERSREWKFAHALALAAVVYAMAILTGLGQGFLYSGIIAGAYGFCLSLTKEHTKARFFSLTRWRPLFVAGFGIMFAAGLASFQILETMRAQRRSIRSALNYETFSTGSFTAKTIWHSFLTPLYYFNWETTAYVPGLAGVCVLAAFIAGLRVLPMRWRLPWPGWFWLGLAIAGFLLMQGDGTPVYRWIYRLPLVNLFRIPWRHAFEFTLALSMLAAFGWDAIRSSCHTRRRIGKKPRRDAANEEEQPISSVQPSSPASSTSPLRGEATLTGKPQAAASDWLGYLVLAIVTAFAFWSMRKAVPVTTPGSYPFYFREQTWLIFKLSLLAGWCALVWWSWTRMSLLHGRVVLLTVLFSACFWEQQVLVAHWCFPFLPDAAYFATPAPSTKFMQRYKPTENRVFTSTSTYFNLKLPVAEPHNISMVRGLHNAAGYEPLLPKRYADAFGSGLLFNTPTINAPLDPQILQPEWQVLDLLNVRLVADFSSFNTEFIEKEGVLFPVNDNQIQLRPGGALTLSGSNFPAEGVSIVTTLADSGDIPQGETVAQLTVHTTDGRKYEYELKAGVDTAEWAHERPDVKATIRHNLPKVFGQSVSDATNSFPAYHYWTSFRFAQPSVIERMELQSKTQRAPLIIWRTGLYSTQSRQLVSVFARLPGHWSKVYDQDQTQIYENRRALPRLWLAPQAEAVSAGEALKRIRGESERPFNPRQTALVETAEVGLPKELLPAGNNQLSSNASARYASYQPNHLVIETNADKPAVLVVSEAHYPGWTARVNGQPTAIYATNYLLRGIVLPAGRHRVEMRYTAPAALSGVGISVLTLGILLGLVWQAQRKTI